MLTYRRFHLAPILMIPACCVVACCVVGSNGAFGQVVQLPTSGTFNLSTSVAVPDSGSGSLGSSAFGRSGSAGRGPLQLGSNMGSSLGGARASVHTTVIDLAELDSMIRSQSGKTSAVPQLHSADPRERVRMRAAPRGRMETAEYDYLAALSRSGHQADNYDPDAVTYYLGMAEQARNRGTWSSVELYYTLAWKNLPPARREAALQELVKARALDKKANAVAKNSKKSN